MNESVFKSCLVRTLVATPVFSSPIMLTPTIAQQPDVTSGVVMVDWKDTAKDKGKKVLKFAAKSSKKTLPVRVGVGLLVPKKACAPTSEEDIKNC